MHDAIQMSGDAGALRAMLDERLSRDLRALGAATEDQLPGLSEAERRLHAKLGRRSVAGRRLIVAGGLVAACGTALAAPLFLASSWRVGRMLAPDDAPVVAGDAGHLRDAERPTPTGLESAEARAKRDALRRAITRHVPVGAAVTKNPAHASGPGAPESGRASSEPNGAVQEVLPGLAEPRSTDLQNKLGPGREKLVQFLNEELSPLLAECVAQAEARSPKLTGMFAVGIETLAYEELGAIIDTADPAARNEVSDPLFFECVRESAFTLIIPPPLTTGQEKFELTGFFGPRPGGDEGQR